MALSTLRGPLKADDMKTDDESFSPSDNKVNEGVDTDKPRAVGQSFDEFVRTLFAAFAMALLIRMFAFEPFNIPSGSMIPNLLIGDYLFVSKYSYGYSSLSTVMGYIPVPGRLFATQPKRGDVVVFKLPSDNKTDYIKRLVGLPGDTVQVRHGLLYINGVAVNRERMETQLAVNDWPAEHGSEDYIETFPEGTKHVIREEGDERPLDNTGVFTVPAGHYFMMGDNRDNSMDSRTTHVSYVPFENLVGRAEIIFFSKDEKTPLWQIWDWPTSIRWDRLFMKIK